MGKRMDGYTLHITILIFEKLETRMEQNEMRIKTPLVHRRGQFQILAFGAAVIERGKDPGNPDGHGRFRQDRSPPRTPGL